MHSGTAPTYNRIAPQPSCAYLSCRVLLPPQSPAPPIPLQSECTTGIDAGTAYYKYLPFDDSTCSSAVACSLLGKAVSRCRALWAAAADPNPTEEESPKVSDDCECTIEASKLVAGGGLKIKAGWPATCPAVELVSAYFTHWQLKQLPTNRNTRMLLCRSR